MANPNPTTWSKNPAKDTPLIPYSDSSTTYNQANVKYSAINVTLPSDGKSTTTWTKATNAG